MTSRWRGRVSCPECGAQVSTEQPIDAWIRNHPDLDSRKDGIVITDGDKFVHRYHVRTKGGWSDRSVQYFMLLELKTFGADESLSQADTHSMFNQLMRTVAWRFQRGQSGRFPSGHPHNVRTVKVYSQFSQAYVQVINYGKHTLKLSGSTPEDSDSISWDGKTHTPNGKKIDPELLVQILRFDLNPDSLMPNDHRRHKRITKELDLFDLEGA